MCAPAGEGECVPAFVRKSEREPFVPEVLKPHFYRVLFLVGSEVEICKQWSTKKTGLPPKPSEAGSVGRGDTAE